MSNETLIWRHGTPFRIRKARSGGYRANRRYESRIITYRISVNGRLVDSALSLPVARRLCERHGRRFLTGEGRYV